MNNDLICYTIHLFGRNYHNRVKYYCQKANVNLTYAEICGVLVENQNKTCQNCIVDNVCLKAPTVSLTIKQMEQIGLVSREADENDSRKTIICLTNEGYEYFLKFKECLIQVEEELFTSINDEHSRIFKDTVRKMVKNLEKGEEN